MTIQIDTREKPEAIVQIQQQFDDAGVQHYRSKLYVADYMSLDNARRCVDRKQSLLELCGNVTQQHTRFIREIKRAEAAGINVIFLCEHGQGITCLDDVRQWENPRRYASPKATSGETLYKILRTMQLRHDNIKFDFCEPSYTGKRIIELLNANE